MTLCPPLTVLGLGSTELPSLPAQLVAAVLLLCKIPTLEGRTSQNTAHGIYKLLFRSTAQQQGRMLGKPILCRGHKGRLRWNTACWAASTRSEGPGIWNRKGSWKTILERQQWKSNTGKTLGLAKNQRKLLRCTKLMSPQAGTPKGLFTPLANLWKIHSLAFISEFHLLQ